MRRAFGCLLLLGIAYLYTDEAYDSRLLVMGITIVAAANLQLVWELLQFEHVHFSIVRQLPLPFLRRCVFHYIRFPDRETMERIVDVHFPRLKKTLLTEALEVFFNLREVPGLKKKPSTSELLDWLKLLLAEDIPVEALRSTDKKVLIPPLHGALLKNEQDVHLFEKVAFMARAGR